MTTSLPPALAGLAGRHNGVFTTAQALRAGVGRDEIGALVRHRQWTRIRRGAYALTQLWGPAAAEEQHVMHVQAVALALRAPTVVSHHSAAVLHGLRLHEVPLNLVHVTHPLDRGSGRLERDVLHHEADLSELDVCVVRGISVTTPARTVIDAARVLPAPSAVVMVDGVLASGASHAELLATYQRQLDWPGSRAAGRAVRQGDGRSDSVGETLGRLQFANVGMAPDALQHAVVTDAGVVRADYAWLAARLVGEFDGKIKYGRLLRPGESTQDVLVRERQRELAIERAGWLVVRFTWSDVHNRELVRRRLSEAMARAERFAS